MEDVLTTEYDGCGRCLVAVRLLSRKTDKTSSPQRQGDQDLRAAANAGGHIIAWADDWEVSGATDPMTRKGLGPWLRGEMGPYDASLGGNPGRLLFPDRRRTLRELARRGAKGLSPGGRPPCPTAGADTATNTSILRHRDHPGFPGGAGWEGLQLCDALL